MHSMACTTSEKSSNFPYAQSVADSLKGNKGKVQGAAAGLAACKEERAEAPGGFHHPQAGPGSRGESSPVVQLVMHLMACTTPDRSSDFSAPSWRLLIP